MPGVAGLLGVIGLNYFRYRRGLPTICATVRRTLPRPAAMAFVGGVFAYLAVHIWRGYPLPIKE